MGFCSYHLDLIFLNGTYILVEEDVSRVKKKDIFSGLSYFLYPGSPSGKTTDLAALTSGGAGVGLPVEIVAVEQCQGLRSLLGVEGRGLHGPKDSNRQTGNQKSLLFHPVHLRNEFKNTYTPFTLLKQELRQ
jgi:hypothetical protein